MNKAVLTQTQPDFVEVDCSPGQEGKRFVLVVDDSKVQRKILTAMLKRWGFQVAEAASGQEAMDFCESNHVDFVLSDWMMPGMNGLEFCEAFRKLDRQGYGYFILLTSKSEKGEIARGLEVGADDFLTKPVNADELRARITAGERILKMEGELQEKNRLVSATLNELTELYDMVDRDLMEAKKLQQSLIRERFKDFGAAQVSLTLRSSGHVGGDLVGFFRVDEHQIGIWGIDVSGHGITSALMTARLAGNLSGRSPEQNVALEADENGGFRLRNPADAADLLNTIVMNEMETEHYFTLLIANVDLRTGKVVMCQAGHPHPVIQRADGSCESVGTGGMPVGLIDAAYYSDFSVTLAPGDRIFIPSDGVMECPDPQESLLDDEGVRDFMAMNADRKGEKLLEAMITHLTEYSGQKDFPDDVSAVLLEFSGEDVHRPEPTG